MQRYTETLTIVHRMNGRDVRTRCRVTLLINMALVFESLGHKAMSNKTRRTRALRGLIEARVEPIGPDTGSPAGRGLDE